MHRGVVYPQHRCILGERAQRDRQRAAKETARSVRSKDVAHDILIIIIYEGERVKLNQQARMDCAKMSAVNKIKLTLVVLGAAHIWMRVLTVSIGNIAM